MKSDPFFFSIMKPSLALPLFLLLTAKSQVHTWDLFFRIFYPFLSTHVSLKLMKSNPNIYLHHSLSLFPIPATFQNSIFLCLPFPIPFLFQNLSPTSSPFWFIQNSALPLLLLFPRLPLLLLLSLPFLSISLLTLPFPNPPRLSISLSPLLYPYSYFNFQPFPFLFSHSFVYLDLNIPFLPA